jgi:hypothetical protein
MRTIKRSQPEINFGQLRRIAQSAAIDLSDAVVFSVCQLGVDRSFDATL